MKKATQLKAIAEATGFSIGTVSVVLNNRGDMMRISKETQEIVRKAADELKYTPNMSARRLRTASEDDAEYVFAFFVNLDLMKLTTGEYLSRLLAEYFIVMQEKSIRGEIVLQPYYPGKLSDMHNRLSNNRYSGVIVNSATNADIDYLVDNSFTVPIIVVNRDTGGKYMNIKINDYEGGKKCAEIFSGNGHKHAGIIGMRDASLAMRMRKMGFVDGCSEHSLEIRDDWIVSSGNSTHEAGYDMMKSLLNNDNRPTAILVMDDNLVLGVISACKSCGVRIPEDLELIVHGTSSIYNYSSPSITSFSVSNRDVALGAFELLMLAMKDPSLIVSKPVFVQFTFRESCYPRH
jgi:LacI family transcriptional regulator